MMAANKKRRKRRDELRDRELCGDATSCAFPIPVIMLA